MLLRCFFMHCRVGSSNQVDAFEKVQPGFPPNVVQQTALLAMCNGFCTMKYLLMQSLASLVQDKQLQVDAFMQVELYFRLGAMAAGCLGLDEQLRLLVAVFSDAQHDCCRASSCRLTLLRRWSSTLGWASGRQTLPLGTGSTSCGTRPFRPPCLSG